jgi:hypothetical protein
MHLQEASMSMAGDEDFIARETTSRSSKLREEYNRSVRLTTLRSSTCHQGKTRGPLS